MHRFLRFELRLILASFSQKKFCLMHASNLLQNIRFPAGWMFLFETTTNHFVDQSPSQQKMEHAMMAADSFLLVAPLKRFIHEAKSNWDTTLKHLLQSLQFWAQSASEPFPLVIYGCCLQCLFSFLLSFL